MHLWASSVLFQSSAAFCPSDRRLALFGHVRRLPEGAPAHDALQVSVELLAGTTSVPDWRRKPGRPRSSWLRGVLKDVGLHLTAQEVWTAADDREGWRAQRSSADYHTRSDDDDDDAVPFHNATFLGRTFHYTDPNTWNSLPNIVTAAGLLTTFESIVRSVSCALSLRV